MQLCGLTADSSKVRTELHVAAIAVAACRVTEFGFSACIQTHCCYLSIKNTVESREYRLLHKKLLNATIATNIYDIATVEAGGTDSRAEPNDACNSMWISSGDCSGGAHGAIKRTRTGRYR